MREMIAADILPDSKADRVYLPTSLDEIVRRHLNMQAEHDRRKKTALPMLAWGPLQGYQAHIDRMFLLAALGALEKKS